MPDAQTQTDHVRVRDAEMGRLRARIEYLQNTLAFADSESIRARAESVTADELVQCRRRVINLVEYNKKLTRLTTLLSSRLGVSTYQATKETLRAAQAITKLSPEAPDSDSQP
jgi:predicted secreted Zn-dependent protease